MNQEFQIPSGNNQASSEASLSDALSFASSYTELRPAGSERIDPVSKKIYEIGKSIADARAKYVDQNFPINGVSEKSIIKSAFRKMFNKDQIVFRNESELKQEESRIGSTLFANSIAPGEKVHFFNDNPKSWFFYKEIGTETKDMKSFTIHYEVNDGGILRISNLSGAKGEFIAGQELENFTKATELYQQLVFSSIYGCSSTSNYLN